MAIINIYPFYASTPKSRQLFLRLIAPMKSNTDAEKMQIGLKHMQLKKGAGRSNHQSYESNSFGAIKSSPESTKEKKDAVGTTASPRVNCRFFE